MTTDVPEMFKALLDFPFIPAAGGDGKVSSVVVMDRTIAANCCPQTPDEMDISESILSDQLEITSSDLKDSASPTEEELSVCEMTTEQHVYISLETSDEEDQQAEADEKVTRTRKPPSTMDKTVHGSNPQQRHIDVKMSSNKEHQRIYDKKNYCLYCEKPFAKLTRHLKQKHADMVEVAKALAHGQGSTQHRLLLEKIRNMGNYHHNCSVLSSGNGLIVPKRQATYLSAATDYLPCKFCFAMYVRKDLWRHHKRCKLQVKNDGPDRTDAANCCPQTPDEVDISESILSDQLEITSGDLKDSPSPTEEESSVCEMDRTVAANCCPQTPDEVDISESILSDQLEITRSDLMDSPSPTDEELSVCEMTTEQHDYISLETSDEEDQQAEADEKVTRTRKPPSTMDKTVHGSNPQQRHINVKMSSNKEHQRIYDKKNYCLYCEKPFAKLTRHLKQKHADMVEVAEALAHRQGSTQHRLLLEKIRNMGNYHHNCSVLSSGNGLIVPKRQATYLSAATDYLPCKFCFAMYVRKDLWRHHKRCKLQVKNDGPDWTDAANCCPQTPDEVDISESILSDQLEITSGDLKDSPSPTEEESSVCEMDRTVAANCCPQTPDEVDISESILSDQLEITRSDLMDSSSPTWEELSTTEQHDYISLETSDEEDQQAEADEKVTRTRKPPSTMDKTVHGSNPQQRHINVKMSSNKEHQRIYDKKNYCLYCEKPFAKLTRHLKQKHADMVEVAKALAHGQGSTQHRLLLEKIRNMGNYHHNCSVLSSGNGLIVPKRQATYLSAATDYLPCKFCFAMYVRKDLWRHHKRCKLQVKNDGPVKRKVQASSSLIFFY
ncbi:hypothetical protein N1851_008399 [Merluccius polli]|uniref:Uncharacterized protein n=1 Tax=Merluccius polli TaxID=89951 RepID=A0AA47P8P9_MERPO|nr:hypothetical protein N1851_008399 [Merluccius polli]